MKILLPSRRQGMCDVSRRPCVISDSSSIADPVRRLLNDINVLFCLRSEFGFKPIKKIELTI